MATPAPGGAKTSLGLEPNIAGVLCYAPCCIGLVFSVVVAIVEKESRLVRFHAFQALLLNVGVLLALLVLGLTQVLLAVVGLGPVAALVHVVYWVALVAAFAIMVLLMIKANSGEQFELPVVGALARGWA